VDKGLTDNNDMDDTELAKIAYQGYGEAVGFKNVAGLDMPDWNDLGDKIQNAWIAAVDAILDQLSDDDLGTTAQD
jgi:hypothetical protein